MELIDKQTAYYMENMRRAIQGAREEGTYRVDLSLKAAEEILNLLEGREEIEKYRTEAMNERELSKSIVAEREEAIIECERLREEIAKESKLKHEAYNNLTRCHEQMSDFAEEIARLKEERDNIRVGRDNERLLKNEAIKQYEAMEARAIQAEKERDARYEFDKQRTIRLEEERNALLDILKRMDALIDFGEPIEPGEEFYDPSGINQVYSDARSIIAKIEGK